MRRTKRHFSSEFKNQILSEAERGTPLTELARIHDLTVTMICRWKRQLRDGEIDQTIERAPKASAGVDTRYVRELEMKLREANEKCAYLGTFLAPFSPYLQSQSFFV